MNAVAVITGPTATGKTRLGALLARDFGGQVVSADSMQVYKDMDIGTAKPGAEEMLGINHHMLGVASPFEDYSVARYVREAGECVDTILSRGLWAFIVGGTGLYIDSLISGRSFEEAPGETALRQELGERYDRLGGTAMINELFRVDPERAKKLSPGDKRRIVRALEVFYTTGKTITARDEESKKIPPRYSARTIILNFSSREELYRRIAMRVDAMLANGLIEEVDSLIKRGVDTGKTSMQAIGYKEIARALKGEISLDEAADLIKKESSRYAKRQLTWLRGKKGALRINWEGEPDFDYARRISTEFLLAPVIK